ncbi:mitochondrial acyl-CoA dehydrogenase [Suillus variegatus]|nr:mitochondrial acyl-CoA dehydrogenase [Suillus variegatus]
MTEEENMFRDSVKRFAVDVVGPKVREMDEKESMDPTIIQGLFEQGLMGIETSVEHGGAKASFVSAIIAIEELAKIDPSVSVMCDVHNTLVNTILCTYGTKEQQDKWLPLLSESKLGSDAFALQTRAKKDGDHWVINGSKMWVTNSHEAEIFLVFTNMGMQIAKKEEKLGIRASSTCTLNFDDLRVPTENIIGGEGKGYKLAIQILNEVGNIHCRIGIAAQMLGLAQGAFDKAIPYTYQRTQFGQPIGTFQGMQFQIARAAVELEAARRSFTKEAAMAKYWASRVAQYIEQSALVVVFSPA